MGADQVGLAFTLDVDDRRAGAVEPPDRSVDGARGGAVPGQADRRRVGAGPEPERVGDAGGGGGQLEVDAGPHVRVDGAAVRRDADAPALARALEVADDRRQGLAPLGPHARAGADEPHVRRDDVGPAFGHGHPLDPRHAGRLQGHLAARSADVQDGGVGSLAVVGDEEARGVGGGRGIAHRGRMRRPIVPRRGLARVGRQGGDRARHGQDQAGDERHARRGATSGEG